jgi:predicted nucleic acid-binding protein
MRIPTIYLETTIFNFPFADDAPQYRDDTKRLFAEIKASKFRAFTSEYVIRELAAATDALREDRLGLVREYAVEVMPASEETRGLATAYIEAGIIPLAYGTDGFHIAAATVGGLDFIVSLNFRHIVKRKTIERTELINYREGYKRIGIYTPAEVIDYENL